MVSTIAVGKLYRLNKNHIATASRILARSFHEDPIFVYILPDPIKRSKNLPFLFQDLLKYGLKYGEVYSTSPNLEGITIWIPPGDCEMTVWRMFQSRSVTLYLRTGLKNIPRMVKASKSQSIHKELVKENHWYLQNIGVDPSSQGKGFAGELMTSMLSRIDKDKLPCYLETNNEKNIAFYKKYGFEVLDKSEIPRTGVLNWGMLREKVKKTHYLVFKS